MGYFTEIETFNTHNLAESSVISLNTGREKLINNIQAIINSNLTSDTAIQHLSLIGPRGIGKSFLLRYFQIKSKDIPEIDYVLFPEEQYNINKPSEFIYEILHHISGNKIENKISFNTNETDEEWNKALVLLKEQIQINKAKSKKYLLIIAIENLDVLLENVFNKKINASRFRNLLNETSDFMILGATLKYDIDSDYNKRLFKAFQKYEIDTWKDDDFIEYFYKRLAIFQKENPNKLKNEEINKNKYKLKAISQFSGGSPRIAIILTNLIFNENLLNTTQTLDKVLENLTAYYMAIFEKIPEKSRILLDTLIRNGENISQTKLAEMVNAKQSDISRAFKILQDRNIVCKSKIKSNKETLYFVSDRMMSLLYNKRYINKDISETRLSVYSDFLISFYEEEEIKRQAFDCFKLNQEVDGRMIASLFFNKNNMDVDIESLSQEEIMKTIKDKSASNQVQEIIKFDEETSIELDNDEAVNDLINRIELIRHKFMDNEDLNNLLYLKYFDIAKYYTYNNNCSKSIFFCKQALELAIKLDNKKNIVVFIGLIGLNYGQLQEFDKAINYYERAMELNKELVHKGFEAFALSQIGFNYWELQKFNKSISYYEKAIELSKELGDKESEALNLGYMLNSYLYLKQEKAWKILNKEKNNIQVYLVAQSMANAIVSVEKWEGRSKGFNMAKNILDNLSRILNENELYKSIKHLFIGLLDIQVSDDLLIDISSLIVGKYTKKEDLISDIAIKFMEYRNSENKEKFIQGLNPDLAIILKSFIKESNIII